MRYHHFTLLLAFTLLLSAKTAVAQQQKPVATNNVPKNDHLLSGNFEIEKRNAAGLLEHINVNYILSPAPFKNDLNLELTTPNPLLFSADIVDSRGNMVAHWAPAQKSYSYNGHIDISRLAAGNYKMNVYCEYGPALLHSVSFQKSE